MSTPRIDDELWAALGDPDATAGPRPAAGRRTSHVHVVERAGSRSPARRSPSTSLVLDRAGLVRSAEVGRERRFEIDERRLARAAAQLQAVGATWDARLSRIKRIAETIQQTQK